MLDHRRHGHPEPEGHAPLNVPAQHLAGQRGPERPDHRQRVERHARDVTAELLRGGGNLAADETGAEDDHPRARGEQPPQPERVVEGAHHVPAHLLAAGDGQRARADARGSHEGVPLDDLAARQGGRARAEVGRGHGLAQPPLDVLDRGLVAEGEVLEGGRAGEGLLRQRRPVVGGVVLVAHHDDVAEIAMGAQPFGRAQPTEATTHHEHSSHPDNLALDRDGLNRTHVGGVLDRGSKRLVRLGHQHDEVSSLVELEHLGRGEHALPVVLAQIHVNDDPESHCATPSL